MENLKSATNSLHCPDIIIGGCLSVKYKLQEFNNNVVFIFFFTADTIIYHAGRIIGKPKNTENAKQMLTE